MWHLVVSPRRRAYLPSFVAFGDHVERLVLRTFHGVANPERRGCFTDAFVAAGRAWMIDIYDLVPSRDGRVYTTAAFYRTLWWHLCRAPWFPSFVREWLQREAPHGSGVVDPARLRRLARPQTWDTLYGEH